MKKFLYVALLTCALTACSTQRFLIDPTRAKFEPDYSKMQVFYLWGMTPQPIDADVKRICGNVNNLAMLETISSGVDVVITYLTLGLVNPRTANVYCKNTYTPIDGNQQSLVKSNFVVSSSGYQLPSYDH